MLNIKIRFLTYCTAALIGFSAPAAYAQTHSQTTLKGPDGNDILMQRSVQRAADGSVTITERTTRNGQQSSRKITRSFDPANGTLTRDVTGTTRSAKTWADKSRITCGANGCNSAGTYTGPRGNKATHNGTSARTAPGTVEGTRTRRGLFGRERTTRWTWRRLRGTN